MASKKKPSIYTDRGAIGSSEELDEYGVWVKGEPQNLSGGVAEGDILPDFADPVSTEDLNEDSLDLELANLDELSEIATEQGLLELPAANNPLSDDRLPEDDFSLENLSTDDLSIDDELSSSNDLSSTDQALAIDNDFTEITLDELIDPIEAIDTIDPIDTDDNVMPIEDIPLNEEIFTAAASSQDNTAQGLSNQLLLKIAEELSSIRGELSALKQDLLHAAAVPEKEDKQASAFFGTENKEDDEKIALTGDELNTILSTADFSAEVADFDDLAASDESDASNIDTASDVDISAIEDFPDIDIDITEELSAAVAIDTSSDTPHGENANFDISTDMDNGDIPDSAFTLEESDLDELAAKYTENNELTFEDDAAETLASDLSPQEESFLDEDEARKELTELSSDDNFNIPNDISEELRKTDISEEELPIFAAEEDEELKSIREEGAQVLTPEPDPEDADYLTEEAQFNLPSEPEKTDGTLVQSLDDTFANSLDISSDDALTDISEDAAFDLPVELTEAVIDEPNFMQEETQTIEEFPSLDDISISLDMEDIAISDTDINDPSFDPEMEHEEEIELLPVSVEDDFTDNKDGADPSLIPEALVTQAMDFDAGDTDLLDTSIEQSSGSNDDLNLEPLPLDDANSAEALTLEADIQSLADGTSLNETLLDEALSHEGIPVDAHNLLMPEIEEAPVEAALKKEALAEVSAAEEPLALDAVDVEPVSTETTPDTILEKGDPATESEIPSGLKKELKTVLSYMDQLMESLPDDKIEEFAQSEHYDTYKKLFKELGLI